jgi:hypothetical protein
MGFLARAALITSHDLDWLYPDEGTRMMRSITFSLQVEKRQVFYFPRVVGSSGVFYFYCRMIHSTPERLPSQHGH